jgi:adenine-specific DNA-methyltransferase
MRFIGSKKAILDDINALIVAKGIKGKTFFDIFSGTTCVAAYFKRQGYSVMSNDLLYFSYVLQKAYIENNINPEFSKLRQLLKSKLKIQHTSQFPYLDVVISFLNKLRGVEGFIYKNYSDEGTKSSGINRKYLTGENAKKIDALRLQIEKWKAANLLTENEYYILLCAVIEAVPFISNISGTYGAFLKQWDRRAFKMLTLESPTLIIARGKYKTYNEDGIELAKRIDCDILYIDPPYNSRQYLPNYHLLETIARYDSPTIKGLTGLRPYKKEKSQFCNRKTAADALSYIAQHAKYKHLIFSYNDEGIINHADLAKALSAQGKVEKHEIKYRRFKSHSNGNNAHKKHVNELIYYVKARV